MKSCLELFTRKAELLKSAAGPHEVRLQPKSVWVATSMGGKFPHPFSIILTLHRGKKEELKLRVQVDDRAGLRFSRFSSLACSWLVVLFTVQPTGSNVAAFGAECA